MAGIGDSWGTADELAHPRGPNGRWIRKGGMAKSLMGKILDFLANFRPRMFQSDQQASQYMRTVASKKPGRFGGGRGYARLGVDLGATNEDLRDGIIDEPSTARFVKMMDDSAVELPDDVIVSRIVGPEAFGFTPQTAAGTDADTDPGIRGMVGKLVADRGYSLGNVGTPLGGRPPGSVLIVHAVPKGTKAIVPSASHNDRSIFLDRDQPLRVTKVEDDGRGGWTMYVTAEGTKGEGETPEPIAGHVGPGRPEDREGRVRASEQRLAKASGAEGDRSPEQEQRAQVENQRRVEVQQELIRQRQSQAGEPPPRQEPVVTRSLGGEPRPEAGPGGTPQTQAPVEEATPRRAVDLRLAVRDADIPAPAAGPKRKQFNEAYQGIISGKKDPIDAVRELDRDAVDLRAQGDDDASSFEKLSDLIKREYGLESPRPGKVQKKAAKKAAPAPAQPRTEAGLPKVEAGQAKAAMERSRLMREREKAIARGEEPPPLPEEPAPTPSTAPAPSTPEAAPAPAKKAAKKAAGGRMTREQEDAVIDRAQGFRGKERNDEERRIVSTADEILAGRGGAPVKKAPAKKAVAKKAAPEVVPEAAPDIETEIKGLFGGRRPTNAQLREMGERNNLGFGSKEPRSEMIRAILGARPSRGVQRGEEKTPAKALRTPAKKAAPSREDRVTDLLLERMNPEVRDRILADMPEADRRAVDEAVRRVREAGPSVKKVTNKAVPEAAGDDLDRMTKNDLLAEAERRGVTVPKSWTKDRIKERLRGEGAAPVAKKAPAKKAPAKKAPAKKAVKAAVPEAAPRQVERTGPQTVQVGDTILIGRDGAVPVARVRPDASGITVARIERSPTRRYQFYDADGKLIDSVNPNGKMNVRRGDAPSPVDRPESRAMGGAEPTPEAPLPATDTASKTRVPEGSVQGDRAQAPVETPARRRPLDEAWKDADITAPGAAGRSMREVHEDIRTGRLTPEEGIRRLESDIAFNKEDLAEIDANLRQEGLSDQDRDRLRGEAEKLQKGIEAQEKASKFYRIYFKDEKPKAEEIQVALDEEGFRALQEATPESLREAAKIEGLDPPKGENKDEVLEDIIHQLVDREAKRRGIKAPAKKVAKKAPAKKTAPPTVPKEKERVDARLLAEGIENLDEATVKEVQKILDGEPLPRSRKKNLTPSQIADWLDFRARGLRDHATIVHGGWDPGGGTERTPEEEAVRKFDLDRARGHARALEELASRVRGIRRRSVKQTPAKKAQSPEIASRDQQIDDVKKRIIDNALEELAQAKTREKGDDALEGLTMDELGRILDQAGQKKPRSKRGRRDAILDHLIGDVEPAAPEPKFRSVSARAKDSGIQAPLQSFSGASLAVDEANASLRAGESPTAVARKLRTRATEVDRADLNDEGRRFRTEMDKQSLRSLRKANAQYLRDLAQMLQQEEKAKRPAKKAAPSAQGDRDLGAELQLLAQGSPARERDPARSTGAEALATLTADWENPMSREDAAKVVESLRRTDLMEMAKELDIPRATRLTMPELRREIVEGTVGRRLDSIATRGFRGARPEAPNATSTGPPVQSHFGSIKFFQGQHGTLGPIRDRPKADEPVYAPNGGRDQGQVHMDSELGSLWLDLYADDREPNSFINEIAHIGEDVGTGKLSLAEALSRLEAMKGRATDSAIVSRIQRAIDAIDAPPVDLPDLPDTVPDAVKRALRQLADIPTARKREGAVGTGRFHGESVLDMKLDVVRRIDAGDRDRQLEMMLRERDLHEGTDGATAMWRIFERLLSRDWVTGYRKGSDGRTEEITEPNPDWREIQDWIRGARQRAAAAGR